MEIIITIHTEEGASSVNARVEDKEAALKLLKGKDLAKLGARAAKLIEDE